MLFHQKPYFYLWKNVLNQIICVSVISLLKVVIIGYHLMFNIHLYIWYWIEDHTCNFRNHYHNHYIRRNLKNNRTCICINFAKSRNMQRLNTIIQEEIVGNLRHCENFGAYLTLPKYLQITIHKSDIEMKCAFNKDTMTELLCTRKLSHFVKKKPCFIFSFATFEIFFCLFTRVFLQKGSLF